MLSAEVLDELLFELVEVYCLVEGVSKSIQLPRKRVGLIRLQKIMRGSIDPTRILIPVIMKLRKHALIRLL